jgi:hypothetical protein
MRTVGTRTGWGVIAPLLIATALFGAACSGGDGAAGSSAEAANPVELSGEIELSLDHADRCEHFDAGGCLLPYPSDHFSVPDDTTASGRRISLDPDSMPINAEGVPVDTAEWNRDDGFSSGTPILAVVPGLDPERSGLAPITDIGASLDPDAPIVVLDADTGERVPYFAELDAGATGSGPTQRTESPRVANGDTALIVRPARNLVHGHRHVVGFRNLINGDGEPIEAADGFRAYRDRLDSGIEAVEQRRPSMERVFSDLSESGVDRSELVLAWDFTVRSTEDATGRLLAMRDDAFEVLGDGAPVFEIDQVETDDAPEGARVVNGRFTVPNYLTDDGEPGSVLNNDSSPDGIPVRSGTREARFICVVPEDPPEEMGAVLFGHGLLGGAEEVRSVGDLAVPLLGITVCGADWIGMARDDIGAIMEMLQDFSDFRIIPDRLQQAHLEFLHLGRLLSHADGLGAHEAFARPDGGSVLDGEVLYVGSSQGGVLGGATSAVATDWDRAALLVPAQNYSMLLDRSVNFDQFAEILEDAYPTPSDRQVLLALAQQLWDRGENNGYSQNLTTDPLPGTDVTTVMLLAAFGDHQVANVATDVLARTAGIPLRSPGLADGRSPDRAPFWDIETIEEWPRFGSLYVMWDFQAPAPPTANVAPRDGDDPHGATSEDLQALAAIVSFLTADQMDDPCAPGVPCGT